MRNEEFEAATMIEKKHAPYIQEHESAVVSGVIENIIQSLEAIELDLKSPTHAITDTIDLISSDDYALLGI